MRGGTGVVGASLSSLGNPLSTFREMPTPSDGGAGIGVRGISGTGWAVLAESEDNAAVVGRSTNSAGIWGLAQTDAG
jgi:hypothetical protein